MEGCPAQKQEPFPGSVDSAELPLAPPKAQSCSMGHLGNSKMTLKGEQMTVKYGSLGVRC